MGSHRAGTLPVQTKTAAPADETSCDETSSRRPPARPTPFGLPNARPDRYVRVSEGYLPRRLASTAGRNRITLDEAGKTRLVQSPSADPSGRAGRRAAPGPALPPASSFKRRVAISGGCPAPVMAWTCIARPRPGKQMIAAHRSRLQPDESERGYGLCGGGQKTVGRLGQTKPEFTRLHCPPTSAGESQN